MIFSIWDNEIEKKEKQKKWTDNFRKIGEEVYTFFVDTVIEKGYEKMCIRDRNLLTPV